MKSRHSRFLLALAFAFLFAGIVRGQGTLRLQGDIAAITGPAAGETVFSVSQGGESSPAGMAASASYTLFSGCRLPGEVEEILQYTLSAGWHILGSPGTSDISAGEVFVGRGGAPIRVGPLQYYNYETMRYVSAADSNLLVARRGFWVFSYWGGESRAFTASNRIAVRDWLTEIPFGAWVLYSPPGNIVLPQEAGLTVFGWNAELQAYEQLLPGDTIEPLRGYWVYRQAG
jgi:hypothetical protein